VLKQKKIKILISALLVAISIFFLFFGLGHYALWDDEADTALFGQAVWRTGDTDAFLDHNIIAHSNGTELEGLKNRYLSPLQFYLAAPFVGRFPGSALAARFPFAVFGFLTIIVIIVWLWKAKASLISWILLSAGIIGNVSFFLFSRQCRYYSLTIFFTVLLAYQYYFCDNRKRSLWLISFTSILLLASNYLNYAAAYGCLMLDYFIWGKKERHLSLKELCVILIPQIILGGMLLSLYNPIGKGIKYVYSDPWLSRKLMMFLFNFRELNRCEFGAGLLILIAPIMYLFNKDIRLVRGFFAILIYILFISVLTPLPIVDFMVAPARYLAPLILLCIYVEVVMLQSMWRNSNKTITILLVVLLFGSNSFHFGIKKSWYSFSQIIPEKKIRSTIYNFAKELVNPKPSSYSLVSSWIKENVKDKETIAVFPTYATYPLMFHAPHALYAWQLEKKEGQFALLSEIYFVNRIPPEYVIAFGPETLKAKQMFKEMRDGGVQYVKIKQLNVFWYDLTRPELFFHAFSETVTFSELENVNIYKKL